MNWIILIVAGFCEVGFTYNLDCAKGVIGWKVSSFSQLSVWSFLPKQAKPCLGAQPVPYGLALEWWGHFFGGIFLFQELITFGKLFFIVTLIVSNLGLKMLF